MGAMDDIFGAAQSGIITEAFIFGLLTMQVFLYFNRYPRDPLWQKSLVAFVWILQCFQMFIVSNMIYVYLIKDITDPTKLGRPLWAWPTFLGIGSTVAFAVQVFYARRVFILCREPKVRYPLSGVILCIALLQWAFGLATLANGFKLKLFADWIQWTWGSNVWLSAATAVDIIIAVSMCILLHSSRTGIKRTDRLINKLIMYSIETCVLTSIAEIVSTITFSLWGMNWAHVWLSYSLGGLYCVSLLANLLSRQRGSASHSQSIRTVGDPSYLEFANRTQIGSPSATKDTMFLYAEPATPMPLFSSNSVHKHVDTMLTTDRV